jgi:hypothetical protein
MIEKLTWEQHKLIQMMVKQENFREEEGKTNRKQNNTVDTMIYLPEIES